MINFSLYIILTYILCHTIFKVTDISIDNKNTILLLLFSLLGGILSLKNVFFIVSILYYFWLLYTNTNLFINKKIHYVTLYSFYTSLIIELIISKATSPLSFLLVIILLIIYHFITIQNNKMNISFKTAKISNLTIIIFSLLLSITSLFFYSTLINIHINLYNSVLFLFIIVFFIINYLLIQLIERINQSTHIQKMLILEKEKQLLKVEYYNKLANQNNEFAKYIHDIHNHLQTIYNYLYEYNDTNIEKYIEDIRNITSTYKKNYTSSNKIFEVFFNEIIHTCSIKNIDFTYQIIEADTFSFIESFDLITITSNMLNNAIEACNNIRQPSIQFSITKHNNTIVIKTINSTNNQIRKDSKGNIITTKNEDGFHGIGIMNIRSSLTKYNGHFDISIKDNYCYATCLIQNMNND